MASDDHSGSKGELYDSGVTVPSDSENYSANNELSSSVHSTSSSPLILYKPPTFWSVLRGAAINLFLPFINGLMLGFGELFAHEAAFRLGWSNTKVLCCFPLLLTIINTNGMVLLGLPDIPTIKTRGCRYRSSRRFFETRKQGCWLAGHFFLGINKLIYRVEYHPPHEDYIAPSDDDAWLK